MKSAKRNLFSVIILILTFSFNSCKSNDENLETKETMETKETKQVFKNEITLASHLAKTQYYRWYQLYERPMNKKRIDNQMDLFIDDITIQSAAGTMKGKENYPERLGVYEGWKNAHHVQNVSLVKNESGKSQIIADIRYQNIQPDGKKASYTLDYIMEFEDFSNTLPKLSKVIIKPTGETTDVYEDAYANNRVNSLMHYWLSNMEQLDGNVKPFEELLTPDFELNFSTAPIKSILEFETWLNGTPKQLSQSSHHPENLKIDTINDTTYKVSVTFDWYGITKNGQKMKAKTLHKWVVIDNPNERFARIKKVDVKQIELLTMVK